jgi:hypothetical protein
MMMMLLFLFLLLLLLALGCKRLGACAGAWRRLGQLLLLLLVGGA